MRLTVLDLTRLLPGGYATHLLREMGARIIKIEDPARGDYLRDFPFPLKDGMSAYFHAINRGKLSAAIDLKKTPELLFDLAKHADVVIESFRPGVMDRLGVGYEQLARRNRGIIYCSIAAGSRAGHDLNFVGQAGLLDLNRGQDGLPAMPGFQIADIAAGSLLAVSGILRAVIERAERGYGQRIDVNMIDGVASLMGFTAAPAALAKAPVEWSDLMLNGQIPSYNLYATADGRWMSVGGLEEQFWAAFCVAMSHVDWVPRQFDRSPEFHAEVSGAFKTRTQAEWIELFRTVDACVEPVLSINEAAAKGMFRYPDKPAPRLGEHTEAVLREFSAGHYKQELFK